MNSLENNNIPEGYKDSAVGIIPQEWEVKTLCECFYISAGRDLQKAFYSATPSEIHRYPIFSNSLENKGLYGYTSHPRHKSGSITITGRGMLGVAEYRNIDFDAIVRLLVLFPKRPITGSLIAEYINFRKPFYLESTGVPQLTAPQIANTPIPVPPIAEQRKIAEILGVWDEAIEKQSRLIEKLELRKRALMQRLLTGRTRLPGFTTPWQKVKLGEMAQIKKGKSLTSNNVKSGLYPVIAGGKDSPYSHNDYTDENVITVSASGAYAGYVSYHPQKIWASDCSVVKEVNTKSSILFLYNLLLYRQVYIYSLQIGGAQPHVFPKDIERVKLLCPPLSEQKAIAEVLTTADDEIATHRKKLDALRLQKRGLMQQLLTGKTRVKI